MISGKVNYHYPKGIVAFYLIGCKKYETVAENVLISVANTDGNKMPSVNNFLSKDGNLATAMRMYCVLGKFINEKIQESVYDKDIPSVEQVEYFAPVFKEID